eukprot:Opistho-1_new@69266
MTSDVLRASDAASAARFEKEKDAASDNASEYASESEEDALPEDVVSDDESGEEEEGESDEDGGTAEGSCDVAQGATEGASLRSDAQTANAQTEPEGGAAGASGENGEEDEDESGDEDGADELAGLSLDNRQRRPYRDAKPREEGEADAKPAKSAGGKGAAIDMSYVRERVKRNLNKKAKQQSLKGARPNLAKGKDKKERGKDMVRDSSLF